MADVRTLIGKMTVPVTVSKAQAEFLARCGRPMKAGTHHLSIADTLTLAAFCRQQARRVNGPRKASAETLARNCNRAMHETAALCRRLARELEGKAS